MRFEAHVYQKNLWSYFNAWELHRKTLRKPFIMFWPRNVNSQSLTQLKALFPTENLSETQRVIKLRFLLCDPLFLKRLVILHGSRHSGNFCCLLMLFIIFIIEISRSFPPACSISLEYPCGSLDFFFFKSFITLLTFSIVQSLVTFLLASLILS